MLRVILLVAAFLGLTSSAFAAQPSVGEFAGVPALAETIASTKYEQQAKEE